MSRIALAAITALLTATTAHAAMSPAAPFGLNFDKVQTAPGSGISIGLTKIETLDGIPNDGYRFDLLNANGESILKHQGPYENVIRGFVGARVFEDRIFVFSRHQLVVLTKAEEGFVIDKQVKLNTEESGAAVAKGSVSSNQRFVVYAEPLQLTKAQPSQRLRLSALDWSTGTLVESKIVLGSLESLERIRVTDDGHIQVLSKL